MQSTLLSSQMSGTSLRLPARPCKPFASRRAALVCRSQQKDEGPAPLPKFLSVPLAAALAGVMLTTAVTPDMAEAARSSGRVGGSSFRSAPRAAPSSGGAGVGSRTTVRNYNTYIAPSPSYGYGGFGGGLFAPSFFAPSPVFFLGGGIFNFIITMFLITTAFGVIRGVLSKKDDRTNDRNDWD